MAGKSRVVIESDALDIAQRLKAIDESYFLVYDREKERYEVHSSAQRGDSFCLSLPFDKLDARTLLFVRKTRVERTKELFDEMDRENELAQRRLAARRRDALGLAFQNAQRRTR